MPGIIVVVRLPPLDILCKPLCVKLLYLVDILLKLLDLLGRGEARRRSRRLQVARGGAILSRISDSRKPCHRGIAVRRALCGLRRP